MDTKNDSICLGSRDFLCFERFPSSHESGLRRFREFGSHLELYAHLYRGDGHPRQFRSQPKSRRNDRRTTIKPGLNCVRRAAAKFLRHRPVLIADDIDSLDDLVSGTALAQHS